jgi:hypothetical protein
MGSMCNDCGIDTTPCTGKRGCRHKGKWEYYMVRDAVWAADGMSTVYGRRCSSKGYLCIKCLESRLGRTLKPNDFTGAIINSPFIPWHTPRLITRLTGADTEARAP